MAETGWKDNENGLNRQRKRVKNNGILTEKPLEI